MSKRAKSVHRYSSHGDHRSAGQTQYEYEHSTACGYVRAMVTKEPAEVTCKRCLSVMRKAPGLTSPHK